MEEKRVFLGIEVIAPWPETLPDGALIDEKNRHLTLIFLGQQNFSSLELAMREFPKPPFSLALVGKFDRCLFLPPKTPRCIAWNVALLENEILILEYQKTLAQWFEKKGFKSHQRHPFIPHVTLYRKPDSLLEWEKTFVQLPLILQNFHLYESLGHSKYQSLWSYPLIAPFQEIEHTADIGFEIFGASLFQLYLHAFIALCFVFPPLLSYWNYKVCLDNIHDVVIQLNEIFSYADQDIGIPFKAISFHGSLKQNDQLFIWEMIIDV